jgi:hypothetical protein
MARLVVVDIIPLSLSHHSKRKSNISLGSTKSTNKVKFSKVVVVNHPNTIYLMKGHQTPGQARNVLNNVAKS